MRNKDLHIRLGVFLIFTLVCRTQIISQNLVPNPSFEIFTLCPSNIGTGGFFPAVPWVNGNASTSDYFNSCDNTDVAGVPVNVFGNQSAHSGDGYAGFIVRSHASDYYEYIQAPLLQPLISGVTYHVRFYVSLGDIYCGTRHVGAYFSSTPPPSGSNDRLDVVPQIDYALNGYLSDYTDWMLVSGCFTAQGGESYITIGNFHERVDTPVDPACLLSTNQSYYYIDDIEVKAGMPPGIIPFDLGGPVTICNSYIIQTEMDSVSYQWDDGTTLDSLIVMVSGNYAVTISDGCNIGSDSVDVIIIEGAPDPVEIGTDTMIICEGDHLDISLDPMWNYLWSDGSVFPGISLTTTGSYSVTLDDGCDISADTIFLYVLSSPMSFSLGMDTAICQGSIITYNFDPVIGEYTWQDGVVASLYEISDEGSYALTISNICGSVSDDIVISHLATDETFLAVTTCKSSETGIFTTSYLNQYGCDSTITLTVSLVPADTTTLDIKTCDIAQVGSNENLYVNQDGCDSLVIQQTTLHTISELKIEVTSDFNGYAISCYGERDGAASAEGDGAYPWIYLWSTGSTDQSISGLASGSYEVTITDANGCTFSDGVELDEPEIFSISFIVSEPKCFDSTDGSITVNPSGGVEPIQYSINNLGYQDSPLFNDLQKGTFTVSAIDANGCETKEIIWINVPLALNVNLGEDEIINSGDVAILNAIVNVPFDSLSEISWSGLINPVCPNCLSQPVAPIITTTYSVVISNHVGCIDNDSLTLFVQYSNDIYIPNIFTPNGDGINDLLLVYGGSGVKQIASFEIFNRWGNLVHSANNFQSDDIHHAWDGRMKGKDLNSDVFAYKILVELKDGSSIVRYGDITLVR